MPKATKNTILGSFGKIGEPQCRQPIKIFPPPTGRAQEKGVGIVASTRYPHKNRIFHNVTQHPVSLRDVKYADDRIWFDNRVTTFFCTSLVHFADPDCWSAKREGQSSNSGADVGNAPIGFATDVAVAVFLSVPVLSDCCGRAATFSRMDCSTIGVMASTLMILFVMINLYLSPTISRNKTVSVERVGDGRTPTATPCFVQCLFVRIPTGNDGIPHHIFVSLFAIGGDKPLADIPYTARHCTFSKV